jgi:hypothetical protein
VVGDLPFLYEERRPEPAVAPGPLPLTQEQADQAIQYMRRSGCSWDDAMLQYQRDLTPEEERRIMMRVQHDGCSRADALAAFRACESSFLTRVEFDAVQRHLKEAGRTWEQSFRDFFDGLVNGYTHTFTTLKAGGASGPTRYLPLGQFGQ